MKKIEWKKYIYKIVIVVLVAFFVGGVGIGAYNILSIEGIRELYTPEEPLSPFPQTDAEIISYVNSAIDKALDEMPKVEMTESFSIDNDTFKSSTDNAQLNASAVLAEDGIDKAVEDSFENKTADFSESAASFLNTFNISPADVEETIINYKYFKCSMCESNINEEEYAEKCPKCGNINTLNERYSDEYEIIIRVKPESASFKNNIFPTTDSVLDIVKGAGGEFYDCESLDKNYIDSDITVRINRLTDEIKFLRYETKANFSVPLKFKNAYESLGEVDITADASDRYDFSFTWPDLRLDYDERTVELGSTEVLKATLTCDDPTAYDVTWTSDNEDILTVDEEGYLKTHKEYGDAVITATFTFKGKEYSDSCLVHVGVPAEGVDLSKGKLKMKVNDTFELKADFNPKDTTNQLCYWYTDDENVAKIDENGVITAVGKGNTTVSVITDDGNYYSSCKVEVTG